MLHDELLTLVHYLENPNVETMSRYSAKALYEVNLTKNGTQSIFLFDKL
jgi:archaellum component FlaF (FlaF/FlaG flagellin family)